MGDRLEEAIKTADINYPGMSVETHNGKDKSEHAGHRHPCCEHCKAFNTLTRSEKLEKTKKTMSVVYICSRCGHEGKRVVFRRNSGPSVSQTRAKNTRDIGDAFLPNVSAFERLSREAVGWLRWAHTSQPHASVDKEAALFHQVRWFAYLKTAAWFEMSEKDHADEISIKLLTVVEMMIRGYQCGRIPATHRQMAKAIQVDHTQFGGNRRWGRVTEFVRGMFEAWESEIINEMGGE